jgi:hypothetical protein
MREHTSLLRHSYIPCFVVSFTALPALHSTDEMEGVWKEDVVL